MRALSESRRKRTSISATLNALMHINQRARVLSEVVYCFETVGCINIRPPFVGAIVIHEGGGSNC